MPSNLAKVAAKEEAAKKFTSKQRKKSKKKATSEKPPSDCPLDLSLSSKEVPIEAEPEAKGIVIVPDDQSADARIVAPESGVDIDV